MAIKYKCEKHGILNANERIMWQSGGGERWCLHCVNEMMDKFCGKLIKIEDNSINQKEK